MLTITFDRHVFLKVHNSGLHTSMFKVLMHYRGGKCSVNNYGLMYLDFDLCGLNFG